MLLVKPKVTPAHRKGADGSVRENWLVYCGTDVDGSSVKYYRSSEKAARELAKEMAEKVRRVGQAANVLTPAQTYDAAEAFQMLSTAEAGITLTECARQWVERNRDALECRTASIKDTVEAYLKRFNPRKPYPGVIRNTLQKFVRPVGENRRMAELDRGALESFLAPFAVPNTFNLNRSYVLAFLHWAARNGMYPRAQYDACVCVERRKVPYRRPVFMHAPEVEAVMRWCERQPDAAMLVPKFAVGFFAGIRTAEIDRMDWAHVHFDTGEVSVESPKGDEETPPRTVVMSDNLVAWMTKYSKAGGKLCYGEATVTARKKRLLADTGIDLLCERNRNVARHTFCTMHFAFHRNYALTQAQLGHYRDSDTFVKNYNNATSQADAAAFWSIMPA